MSARLDIHQDSIDDGPTPKPHQPRLATDASGRLGHQAVSFARPALIGNPDTPLHVTHCDAGWNLKFEGTRDFVGIYPTKKEAMKSARKLARKHDVRLVEHRLDGTFV